MNVDRTPASLTNIDGPSVQRLRVVGRALAVSAAGVMIALSGCSGHGKHTQGHKNQAEARLAQMKSATEWDMARQAYLAGDLDKALRHIDRSIALNDNVAKSQVLRGRILLEMGNFEGAIASLERASDIEPESVDAAYYLGLCYERIAKREQALEYYLLAASMDSSSGQYPVAAAEMMIDLDRLDDAREYLEDRSSALQHNPGVKQALGQIALLQGRGDDALELFTEARLLSPDDNAILEDLVRAQIATERYAEAEYHIARLSEIPSNKGRRDLQHMRARCLLQVDRALEAREILIALTSDQAGAKDVEAWIMLGHTSYVLGDVGRLKQAAARVIALAPARSEGYMLRAMWQRNSGDRKAALSALDEAVTHRGTDTAPLVLRAIVAQEMGRLDIAEQSLAQAAKENPSDINVSRLLSAVRSQRFAGASEGQQP